MAHPNFRVGIIGAGGVVKGLHLPGWLTLPGVGVVALADINKAAASALSMEFGVPHVFTDYNEMLKMDLDAVDVCTPNLVHYPAVKAALEAGKHVICEKPLAVTAREVRELGELADSKGLKLMTAQHHRFGSTARAAKRWAEEGFLGPVYHARVKAMRRATLPVSPGFIDARLSGGGPCMDIGVHALDLCLWLMSFPDPIRVSGVSRVNFAKGHGIPGMWGEWNRELYSVEDFAAGFIHFRDPEGNGQGASMTLETAWLGHQVEHEDMSCQLFGRNGGVKWPSGEFASVQGGIFAQGTLMLPMNVEKPHYEELRAFRECIVSGAPSPVPWRETEKVIAILEAIYASQDQGREVDLGMLKFFTDSLAFATALSKDSRIPTRDKAVLAGFIALIISPIDIIPDFIPVLGQLDDLMILILMLDYVCNRVPEEVLHDHFPWNPNGLLTWRRRVGFFAKLVPHWVKDRIWKAGEVTAKLSG